MKKMCENIMVLHVRTKTCVPEIWCATDRQIDVLTDGQTEKVTYRGRGECTT